MGTEPLEALGVKISDIQPDSQRDLESKVTLPYLERIKGYTPENGVSVKLEVTKGVPVGDRMEIITPDIAMYVNSEPFLMVKSKPINQTIERRDVKEAVLNARLYESPKQFPYSVVSTGLKWEVYDTSSELYLGDHQVIPDIGSAKWMVRRGVQLRIGVFVCHCGLNIGGVVDVPAVVEYAKTLPGVVYAEDNLYTCSAEGTDKIKEAIKAYDLNRVVVASCTPRTHEPVFRNVCKDAGLNPYLFEFANIREHCSWVHMHEPEEATEKAKDIVRMSVARASLLEPQIEAEVQVEPTALVIGAGVSGLTTSLCMANQGFNVYLVEKEAEVGGMLRSINMLYPTGEKVSKVLEPLIKAVRSHPRIQTLTSTLIKKVSGYVGNFDVTVLKGGGEETRFKVGTIIVATGARELQPHGMYGYGEYDGVVTQMQLEQLLKEGVLKPKRVVMLQCVGSRQEKGITYCSRICCMVAVKNAMLIKGLHPDADVYIIYQDFQTYGKDYEEYHRRARDQGIRFIKYEKGHAPEVLRSPNGKLRVKVFHALLGEKLEMDCDLVVLSTPLVPQEDAKELSKMIKVPLGEDGFFYEAHVKLRPVDFAMDGIYVCGTAHFPKDIDESVSQAYAAASRATGPMANRKVTSEALTAVVNPDLCVGCGLCEELCPYGAHRIERGKSKVIAAVCRGCGVCDAECPRHAITMRHHTDEQILAQIDTALSGPLVKPKILGFLCNWCGYAGADTAGTSRISYPPNIRIVRVMCSGRVDPVFILRAFEMGADGVMVAACHIGDCHYVSGNEKAKRRIEMTQKLLASMGLETDRLRLEWISGAEGEKFARAVNNFTEALSKMGPNTLRTNDTVKLSRIATGKPA